MMAVFAHGQLRLYLLSLLEDGPRHGYELITALSDRFGGLYRPSAGTVYPRLARLQEDGLVARTQEGRTATYALTDRGRQELRDRRADLVALEHDVARSVRELAAQVRTDVVGSMAGLRAELAAAAQQARAGAPAGSDGAPGAPGAPGTDARDDAGRHGAPGEPDRAARREQRAAHRRRVRAEADLAAFRTQVRAALREAEQRGGITPLTAETVRTVLASARAAIEATLPR
ncbi:PadR family transcriptional regulator [Cellulomonas sp. ES6]|nr:PadR family transcriptional regulator [Cellulomonas sp. ES6]WHP19527.1 PadR family transcriptional regulator [Cellulomonas sp. ES6]